MNRFPTLYRTLALGAIAIATLSLFIHSAVSQTATDHIWTEGGTSGIAPSDPIRFDTIRNLAESLGGGEHRRLDVPLQPAGCG